MAEDLQIPSLEEVFKSVAAMYLIIDLIDSNYKIYKKNYIMRYWKNRGVSLREIFTRDIINWLCFLGWSDSHIDINEVRFINQILDLNLTQMDILEIIKELDPQNLSTIPMIFSIFIEYETFADDMETSIVGGLYSLFSLVGAYFIGCDGDIDPNEIEAWRLYLDTLNRNIRTFNLEAHHSYLLDQL